MNRLILSEIAWNQNKLSKYFCLSVNTAEQDCVFLALYRQNYQLLFDCCTFLTADKSQLPIVAWGGEWACRKTALFLCTSKKKSWARDGRARAACYQESVVLFYSPQTNTHTCHMPYSWAPCEDEPKCSSKASLSSWTASFLCARGSVGRVAHRGQLPPRTFGYRAWGSGDKLMLDFDWKHGGDFSAKPCPWACWVTGYIKHSSHSHTSEAPFAGSGRWAVMWQFILVWEESLSVTELNISLIHASLKYN